MLVFVLEEELYPEVVVLLVLFLTQSTDFYVLGTVLDALQTYFL